jgi:hypothetical protein
MARLHLRAAAYTIFMMAVAVLQESPADGKNFGG